MPEYPFTAISMTVELEDIISQRDRCVNLAGGVVVEIDRIVFVNTKDIKSTDNIVFKLIIPPYWKGFTKKQWNKYGLLLFEARKKLYDENKSEKTLDK